MKPSDNKIIDSVRESSLGTLVIGTFPAEHFWDDKSVARLPSIVASSRLVVGAMDELLLSLCGPDDLLVSRYPLNPVYQDYLCTIRNSPTQCISVLMGPDDNRDEPDQSTASLLLNICEHDVHIRSRLSAISRFRAYAVNEDVKNLACSLKLTEFLPQVNAVIKVNSKRFAKEVTEILLPGSCQGFHSENINDLTTKSREFLKHGAVVFKEDFGVSGKGNLMIETPRRLDRVLGYLQRQLNEGKCLSLIVEPFFNKMLDFSCHFDLAIDGEMQFRAVQFMLNQGFGYAGSAPCSDAFCSFLDKSNYFRVIELVAKLISEQGYFGPVCIDSMVLKDNSIIPVVEINARYSMGRICNDLIASLEDSQHEFRLISLTLGRLTPLSFEELILILKNKEQLLRTGGEQGVCPLSANMLDLHDSPITGRIVRGRLYALLSDRSRDHLDILQKGLLETLSDAGMKVFDPPLWPQNSFA